MQQPAPTLRSRSFGALVGAQFLGAFNDNLFKALILLLAARVLFPGEDRQALATICFALPFVVFSGLAGELSERFSKRRIIVAMKVAEILVMGLGAVALTAKSWPLLLATLGLMGTQSAFFGPSKYGVIPELVDHQRLLPANGVISMTTFVAVLIGTALAGPLLDRYPDDLGVPAAICAGIAVVGTAFAAAMRPLAPRRPDLRIPLNPFGGIAGTFRELATDRSIVAMVFVNSFFWFNGSVVQQAINGLGAPGFLDLAADENWMLSTLQVTLALAIILGSSAVPLVAKLIPVPKMVATGAVVMMTAQIVLVGVGPVLDRAAGGWYLAIGALALVGFFGAWFYVPVTTFLQEAPPDGARGKTMAVVNFVNWVFILLGGAFYFLAPVIGPGVCAAASGTMMAGYLLSQRRWVGRLADTTGAG